MRKIFLLFVVVAFSHSLAFAQTQFSESPTGARAYIISPQDGETVDRTFVVKFGLKNMGIAPAGVDFPNTGHHHLLIDFDKLPDLGKPLVFSKNLKHFGGGQTEAEITLAPGKHTLQLVLGSYTHIPHKPPVVSEKITITVVDK